MPGGLLPRRLPPERGGPQHDALGSASYPTPLVDEGGRTAPIDRVLRHVEQKPTRRAVLGLAAHEANPRMRNGEPFARSRDGDVGNAALLFELQRDERRATHWEPTLFAADQK